MAGRPSPEPTPIRTPRSNAHNLSPNAQNFCPAPREGGGGRERGAARPAEAAKGRPDAHTTHAHKRAQRPYDPTPISGPNAHKRAQRPWTNAHGGASIRWGAVAPPRFPSTGRGQRGAAAAYGSPAGNTSSGGIFPLLWALGRVPPRGRPRRDDPRATHRFAGDGCIGFSAGALMGEHVRPGGGPRRVHSTRPTDGPALDEPPVDGPPSAMSPSRGRPRRPPRPPRRRWPVASAIGRAPPDPRRGAGG